MLKKPAFIGISIISLILITVLLVNVFVYAGMKNMFPNASVTGDYSASEKQERKKVTPVTKVSTSADVPAQQVINSIMKKDVDAVRGWKGGDPNSGTPSSVFSWVCGNIKGKGMPHPSVANSKSYTQSGRKNFTTLVAYAYGAGGGKTAVNKLQEQAKSCSGPAGLLSEDAPVSDANGGFSAYYSSADKTVYVNTWAVGDVVLTVASTSRNQSNVVAGQYDDYTRGLLEPMCIALTAKESDITRNPYFSEKNYTGWNKGRKVNLDKNIPGINPGFISKENPISGKGYALGFLPGENNAPVLESIPGDKISYNQVNLPNPPMKPYPDILPDPVKKPLKLPKAPKVPKEAVTVAERVKDDRGPGCGWAFTNQASPVFDDRAEKKAADERENKAQDKMQSEQVVYHGEVADYVEAYEKYAISVEEYKDYYDKVEKVRSEWQEIKDKRNDYRKRLDQYYADIKARKDFLERQEQAEKDYEKALDECEAFNDEVDKYNDDLRKDQERYNREVEEWRDKKQKEADKDWEEAQKDSEGDATGSSDDDSGKDSGKDSESKDADKDADGNETLAPKPPKPTKKPSKPKDYSNVTPPADEVPPPGTGLTKPKTDSGVTCPAVKPAIIDQAPPAKPSVPKKPDVELPYAWDDIPDEG